MTRAEAVQAVKDAAYLHEKFPESLRDDLRRAVESAEVGTAAYRVLRFAHMRAAAAVERIAELDRKLAQATEERAETLRDLPMRLFDRRYG